VRWRALVAAAVLACAGCCTHEGARKRAAAYAEINRAHAADASLPKQARLVGQDNADSWAVQSWRLGGAKPGRDVFARLGVKAPQ